MNLRITFDDALLLRYDRRGASASFGICWEHEGTWYPSPNWIDFGAVILDWWMIAARNLMQGERRQELYFMDGPFRLILTLLKDGTTVVCTDPKESLHWIFTLNELITQLRNASMEVV